jgi:L,D-transpeptidase ErfK/SrfK
MPTITLAPRRTLAVHALAVALASAALCGSGQSVTTCGTIAGDLWIHVVSKGESWATIGARVGVDPEVLAKRNERSVRTPLSPGDVLGIDNRHIVPAYEEEGGLLINVPQRMLFHYSQGAARAQYPVAVGEPDWPTPLGRFSIVAMETEPTWDVPPSIQEEMRRAGKAVVKKVPPGPDNPLGRYWMGLDLEGIGIHGTTAPSSIYHYATHGCIRLHPDDVEELFHFVTVGEPGRVVYEPVLVAFDGMDVYLEVHRDPYDRVPSPVARALQLLDQSGLRARVDLAEVVRVVREAEGLAVPVTAGR